MTDGKLYLVTLLAGGYLLAWYGIGATHPTAPARVIRIEERGPARAVAIPRVVRTSRPLRVRTRSS